MELRIDFRQKLFETDGIPKTVILPHGEKVTFSTTAEGGRKLALGFTKLVLDGVWFGYVTKEKRPSAVRDNFIAYPIGRLKVGDEEFMYIFYTLGFRFPNEKNGIVINEVVDVSKVEAYEYSTPVFTKNPSVYRFYQFGFQPLSNGEWDFIDRNSKEIMLAQNIRGITTLRRFPTGEILALGGKKLAFATDAALRLYSGAMARAILTKLIEEAGKTETYNISPEQLSLVEFSRENEAFKFYENYCPGIILSPEEVQLLVKLADNFRIDSITYRLTEKGMTLILKERGIVREVPMDVFLSSKGFTRLDGYSGVEYLTMSDYARSKRTKIQAVWLVFARYLLHKFGINSDDLARRTYEEVLNTIRRIVSSANKVPSMKHLQMSVKEQATNGVFHTVHKYIEDGKAYVPKLELLKYIKLNEFALPGDYQTFSRILAEITDSYSYGSMDCFVFTLTEEEIRQEEKIESREVLREFLSNSAEDVLTEIPERMLDEVRPLGVVFITGNGKAKMRMTPQEVVFDVLGKIERRASVGLQFESEEIARKVATIFEPYEPKISGDMVLFGDTDLGYGKYYVRISDDGYLVFEEEN
jgi:hypothetical protein